MPLDILGLTRFTISLIDSLNIFFFFFFKFFLEEGKNKSILKLFEKIIKSVEQTFDWD